MLEKVLNRSSAKNGGRSDIILLATDGSKPALTATKKAVELAKATGSTLHVLCVKEDLMSMPLEKKGDVVAEEQLVGIHAKGGEVAMEWAELNSVPAVLKTYLGGPVVGAILDYARQISPAFIVLGSAGRSGWEKITLGSVAEGVMKHSPYPVVMTKGYQDAFIEDILQIALAKIMPPEEEVEEEVELVSMEELGIGRKLGVAFGTLMAFLIPYFGLGALNSLSVETATTKLFGDANVAIVWVLLLFPIGWVTAIVFHRLASRKEAGQ
ncbi:MAG: universal stress protein [Methanomassiliicoccales archaeon]|nr:universal stress protein [Methanomassiliicoccales archaeon]